MVGGQGHFGATLVLLVGAARDRDGADDVATSMTGWRRPRA